MQSPRRIQRGAVAFACVALAATDLNFSLLAPFFPNRRPAHGQSAFVIGVIFALQPLAALLITPLTPALIRAGGAARVLTCSLVAQAAFAAAFGFVDLAPTAAAFTAAACALRVCQGATAGCAETAATSLVMRAVPPDLVGSAVGWSEASRALGSLAGPAIGGVLYHAFGFSAPFYAAGALLLLLVPAAGCVPRQIGAAAGDRRGALGSLLRSPPVVAACLTQFVCLVSICFLDPTLQPALAQPPLGLTAVEVGLLLSMAVLVYALVSVVSGFLASRLGNGPQLAVGLLLMALGFVALGPTPLLPARFAPPRAVGTVAAALCAVGFGGGLGLVPTTNLLVLGARRRGLSVDESSASIAALSNVAFSSGAVVGPLLGGALLQVTTFAWATTALGLGIVALPLLLAPCLLARGRSGGAAATTAALVSPVGAARAAAAAAHRVARRVGRRFRAARGGRHRRPPRPPADVCVDVVARLALRDAARHARALAQLVGHERGGRRRGRGAGGRRAAAGPVARDRGVGVALSRPGLEMAHICDS